MDPKTIFASIEKTRSDIEAHVRRLATVRPHAISTPPLCVSVTDSVANVLDAAMVAQVATAIEHLEVVNKAQDEKAGTESEDKAGEPPVIDLHCDEYKEVDG